MKNTRDRSIEIWELIGETKTKVCLWDAHRQEGIVGVNITLDKKYRVGCLINDILAIWADPMAFEFDLGLKFEKTNNDPSYFEEISVLKEIIAKYDGNKIELYPLLMREDGLRYAGIDIGRANLPISV